MTNPSETESRFFLFFFFSVLFHFAIRLESELSPTSSDAVIQIPSSFPGDIACCVHLPSLIFPDSVFSTVTYLTAYENVQSYEVMGKTI